MEAALISPLVNNALTRLIPLIQQKYKLHKGLGEDIKFLSNEVGMIACKIDDELLKSSPRHSTQGVRKISTEQLRELAFDIEDCIDRFLYDTTRARQANFLKRAINLLKPTTLRFAEEIRRLKKKPDQLYQRKQRYSSPPPVLHAEPSSSSSGSEPLKLKGQLVGIDVPLEELLQLVEEEEPSPGQAGQLKVISIVGSDGVGKTVLARQAFESYVGQRFSLRAWVCAEDNDAQDLLRLILEALSIKAPVNSDARQLSVVLRDHLDSKRFFIVIDDMRKEQWDTLESAFPDNGQSSRIIVTTAIRSIAKACSSTKGYVYTLTKLKDNYSRQLFFGKALIEDMGKDDLKEILDKCDGLPLALDSIAQFVRIRGSSKEDVCRRLGYHIEKEDTLARLRRVLYHNYTNLPGDDIRLCLLYLAMFPSDYPIRKKSLIRRWLAEGFVESEPAHNRNAQDVATENFEMLVDRNIILPSDVITNNEKVKTCHTYGMMLEFILHKSLSQRFIANICEENLRPKHIRRISLHRGSLTNGCLGNDLSFVRSLIIFGEVGEHIVNFKNCQLLRLLDLEECNDIKDNHLEHICDLLLLKYLSLGCSITKLPREIEKLQFLETLDVRRTKVNKLPIEVIMLPSLIHLLGKFKHLGRVKQMEKLQKFLSEKSKLQTLAGIFINCSEGFPQLLSHMKKLRNVKLWCESTARSSNLDEAAKRRNLGEVCRAIQNFIRDNKTSDVRSLSLHFDNFSEDLLNDLRAPCYLTSLKLHGNLQKLPNFVGLLRGLKELCLSCTDSTGLNAELLPMLVDLKNLLYLKLIADHIVGQFVVRFPRLLSLCLKLQQWTPLEIKLDALPQLVSLQLLCEHLDGLSGIKIQCLERVKEIVLDSRVKKGTEKIWRDAAKEHPNRPRVVLFETIAAMEIQTGTNSQMPLQGGSSSSVGKKRKQNYKLGRAFNKKLKL